MGTNKTRARWASASPVILSAAAAIALYVGMSGSAQAVSIDSGDPDLKIRWDNTIKYTLAVRTGSEDKNVAPGPYTNFSVDDGDNNFKAGDLTSNRLDLLTEFDVDYQHRMGFRVSAAGWYDQVYQQPNSNRSPLTSNNLGRPNNTFADSTKTLQGRDAEFLDAFVYRNFALDNGQNLDIRLGRHSLLWGESLFWGGNAIAGTQQPVDVVKALSLPGAQFKEIIMPVGQASVSYQVSSKLSFGAFFQFEDRKERDPTVGSFLSFADFYDAGGNYILVGPGLFFQRTKTVDAYKHNQGGAQLRWKASDNWEFGFYGVNFDARTPQFYLTPAAIPKLTNVGVQLGTYREIYAQNTQAFGASVATLVGDTNVSAEVSMRNNQPLAGNAGGIITDLSGTANVSDKILYPVGKTAHANASAITLFPASPLWDGAALVGEMAYNYKISVDNGQPLDPNTTPSAWAAWLNFEPSYFQVMPGLDITTPITVTYVFGGRSSLGPSIFNFIGENSGSVTFGVSGLYQDRYKMALQYTAFYGKAGPFATGPDNHYSYQQQYADRNYLALTLSTTF